ncbi:MAG: PLP-dependent transferase, partial [Planctomycetales bacterium]|nr:PLP-dependent transferase [Planctomycetales bacterium]
MPDKLSDICPRPARAPAGATHPHAPPIHLASVYACESPQQAQSLLAGEAAGFVYQRDGHPNAHMLADKLAQLHSAARAIVTSHGMSALSAAALSQLSAGDHVVASDQLYGRSL